MLHLCRPCIPSMLPMWWSISSRFLLHSHHAKPHLTQTRASDFSCLSAAAPVARIGLPPNPIFSAPFVIFPVTRGIAKGADPLYTKDGVPYAPTPTTPVAKCLFLHPRLLLLWPRWPCMPCQLKLNQISLLISDFLLAPCCTNFFPS